jgi:hypothetical protein
MLAECTTQAEMIKTPMVATRIRTLLGSVQSFLPMEHAIGPTRTFRESMRTTGSG